MKGEGSYGRRGAYKMRGMTGKNTQEQVIFDFVDCLETQAKISGLALSTKEKDLAKRVATKTHTDDMINKAIVEKRKGNFNVRGGVLYVDKSVYRPKAK